MLDIPKQRVVFLAHHQRQELTAEPAVAMLAAERAPITLHQVCNFGRNHSEEPLTLFSLQIQNRTQMQLTRGGMTIMDCRKIAAPENIIKPT